MLKVVAELRYAACAVPLTEKQRKALLIAAEFIESRLDEVELS